MGYFDNMLEGIRQRRECDAQRFAELDDDLCQLCGAYGADKRNLVMDCGYAVHEVVPEAIDLHLVENDRLRERGYYLRICKSCRAALLQHIQGWREERIALRSVAKDHDGYTDFLDDSGVEVLIPICVPDGRVVLTPEQFETYREKREYMPSGGEECCICGESVDKSFVLSDIPALYVCKTCKRDIEGNVHPEFVFEGQRYIVDFGRPIPVPAYVEDALLWLEETRG